MSNLSCFILACTGPLESHSDKASNDGVAKVPTGSIKGQGGRRDRGTWKNGFDAEITLRVNCNKRLTVYN